MKVKKTVLRFCVSVLETYIPTVSNVIKKFTRSIIERLLVALIQSRKTK